MRLELVFYYLKIQKLLIVVLYKNSEFMLHFYIYENLKEMTLGKLLFYTCLNT